MKGKKGRERRDKCVCGEFYYKTGDIIHTGAVS